MIWGLTILVTANLALTCWVAVQLNRRPRPQAQKGQPKRLQIMGRW